jgi:hypothetical protein
MLVDQKHHIMTAAVLSIGHDKAKFRILDHRDSRDDDDDPLKL